MREFLVMDLERGFLTEEEYKQLGSIAGRMGSSFNALSQSGVKGWRARMRFNQLASELAFHRSQCCQRRPFCKPGRPGAGSRLPATHYKASSTIASEALLNPRKSATSARCLSGFWLILGAGCARAFHQS